MSAYPPPGMAGPQLIARWSLRTMTSTVRVEGIEHVPRDGPVLLAAHHYHHLLDGAVLVRYVPRPVHVVVGLDWTANALQRRWMERVCRWARWPVILRPPTAGTRGGYAANEVARYLRSGVRDAAALLRERRVVAMFPEGYPVVDPAASVATPQVRDGEGFLPFAAGFRTIVDIAHRNGADDVAVVPVGFHYASERDGGAHGTPRARWTITARFGRPCPAGADAATVERSVRELSR